jgi:hypothetical protein
MSPSASRVDEVAGLLVDAVRRHYGPGPRTDDLRAALARFGGDRRAVDPTSLAEVEAAGQAVFRHLELSFAHGLRPQERSPGWPEPDLAVIRRAGADVAGVRRDPDGTATLRLTGLAPVQAAAPLLAGAFALVQDARTVVLDLRDNGGGDPATVALIVDWLAGEAPRHLFDVVYARVRQWWTAGAAPAPRPTGEVRALIGRGTYSSGEALAWTLQHQRLATLVGLPTRGAADHVVPLDLAHDVRAVIPEARVMAPDGGTTWEGVGVQPDRRDDTTA